MTMRPITTLLSIGLAAGVLAVAAGCFSEHVDAPNGGQCVAAPDSTPQGSSLIHIDNFSFQPASTCLTAGTSATWINDDTPSHSSTADQGDWDSPLLSPGQSFSFTFPQAGTFAYHCTPHPFMQGSVVVQ